MNYKEVIAVASRGAEGKRAYDGSRRQADALERQRRIVAAATDLFIRQGFGATSINQIASAADVSAQTIYATYTSKAGVLAKAIDVAVAGDFDDVPVIERVPPLAGASPTQLFARFAEFAGIVRALNERVAPLIRVLEQAASSDAVLGQLRSQLVDAIRTDALQWVGQLGADRLRPDLSEQEAADVLATTSSPAVYSILTEDSGWTPEQYERWLAAAVPRLLLAAELLGR
ncbi:MAG TPA: TetR/AcrR family transcriptional regulator [Mycobacterium sp.]